MFALYILFFIWYFPYDIFVFGLNKKKIPL